MGYKGGSCIFCGLPEAELRALIYSDDGEEFLRHMGAQCMIDPKTPREIKRASDLEALILANQPPRNWPETSPGE